MKWIIAAVFLCYFTNQVTAAEYSWNQSSGNHVISITTNEAGNTVINGNVYTAISAISVSGGTLTINFGNTSPVILNGTILLTGGTINIVRTGPASTEDNPTLKKKNGNLNARIEVRPPSNGSAKLNFNNDANYPLFVYDGGCMNFRIEPDGNFYKANADGQSKNYALVKMSGGVCRMQNTILTNNWNAYADGATGGAFDIYKNASGKGFTLELTNCTIKNCYAKESGSAIYFVDSYNNGSSITMTDCDVTNCFVYADNGANGMGGTIRTLSSNYASFTMIGCNIDGNYSVRGGALLWNAARAPMPHLEDCSFTNNWEKSIGGAALYIQGSMELVRCNITNNHTLASGGGVFYSSPSPPAGLSGYNPGTSGTLTIDDQTEISNNEAAVDGGGLYVYTKAINSYYHVTEYTLNLEVNGATISDNKAGRNGGAIYLTKDDVPYTSELHINYGSIRGNRATGNGGAVCVEGLANNPLPAFIGTPTGTEDLVIANDTATNGGGIYVKYGDVTFYRGQMGGVDLTDPSHPVYLTNVASGGDGGGIYVDGGSFNMYGGTFAYNEATKSGGTGGNGGGFYVNNGTIDVEGGLITHNTAADKGGGFYVDPTNANDTTFIKQGALGAEVSYNQAHDGGAAYVLDGVLSLEGSTIGHNTAVNGGAFYSAAGMIDFSGGLIEGNYASGNGGGIYVAPGATVKLRRNAELKLNHVPYANGPSVGHGGGIYLAGQVLVGNKATDEQGYHTLKVQTNYEGTPTKLNNIYLPTESNVIELLSDMRGSTTTKVGFSVDNGFRKVVKHAGDATTSSDSWLHGLLTGGSGMNGVIFDDAQKYMAVHVLTSDDTFDHNFIYLWGCWISAVNKDPNQHITDDLYPLPPGATFTQHYSWDADSTFHIYTKYGLAWFSSLVNGLNHREDALGHTEADSNPFKIPRPDLKAVMECDVDLHEFLWVPLGSAQSFNPAGLTPGSSLFTDGHTFAGEFDGQGHTISGLDCRYINSIHNYGLFGKLVGEANVCNTFVDNYLYSSNEETDESGVYFMGGIAGVASDNSIISNCEARGRQSSPLSTISILGGIVGNLQDNATVHSSIGLPELAGVATTMGGIAGQTAAGTSIRNSYSNPKIGTVSGNVGGLVGTNAGTVENCYVRLQHATAPTNFYWFAAVNNGTVGCCYARNDAASDHYTTVTAATGSGTYGFTQLPYLYKHRDTQVAATNDYVPTDTDADKQLMIVLNRWVDTINSKQSAINYTKWGRPWQESDAQKPLNDDYPILKMPVSEAVAAEAGDPYLYYGTVDNLLTKYDAAGDAIWMYRNSESVTGDNSTSAAKLYIAEDVALLNAKPLKAYVGITLDNSAGADGAYPTYFPGVPDATDWHMIATPLSDAPIGINYDNGTYDFDNGHPSGMPYYLFYPKDDAKHGYFPSHRFGKDYPISDATIEEGNYYTEWDFYSYYEPEYHWINFKRNSASHHHMQAEDHSSIDYYGDGVNLGNETRLVPGKGYFAATREETFLQCQGHLNNGAVAYNLTQTSGVPRHGYNLIGNPYQAYLNFDAFADANSGSGDNNKIWTVAQHASYTILDEDELDTITNVETVMGVKPVFYRTYLYGSSSNPDVSAGGFIHPHQGFFVRLEGNKASAQAQFAPGQRNATAKSKFRGNDHIDYPLVNLFAIEGNGAADVVTVELGRPDEGGAPLMQGLRVGNGKIWCHYDDKDYAIAYTQPGISEVGIRFETVEDTEYTMRWSTRNGDFSYLHLIDNKTGADVDCLATDEYKFSASTSDYKSRFRLVFGYTGIEEPEAEANENFAFMMNDALVVTGEGVLQVFDMTGRMVANQELHGGQTTVSLPAAANGVYVLRLTNGRQSQVQKMVISK